MSKQNSKPSIAIAGAGSIGFFIGGLLHHAGHKISFLARERMIKKINQYGLRLTDYTGLDLAIEQSELNLKDNPKRLSKADIILVTVKSSATKEMAELIKSYAKPNAIIISLQNGMNNGEILKATLKGFEVLSGMVPFNVAQMDGARFHRGTSGNIVIQRSSKKLAQDLITPNLTFEETRDIKSIQSGKLLINLNNALNALSGLTLREQLNNRGWRKIIADQMSEAHKIMKSAGMEPKPPSPVPASLIPYILKLPTPLFKLIAKQMLAIDPLARSSMWEDLKLGRKTEIDELQGVIMKLANKHNLPASVNTRVLEKIKQAEKLGTGSPHLQPKDI